MITVWFKKILLGILLFSISSTAKSETDEIDTINTFKIRNRNNVCLDVKHTKNYNGGDHGDDDLLFRFIKKVEGYTTTYIIENVRTRMILNVLAQWDDSRDREIEMWNPGKPCEDGTIFELKPYDGHYQFLNNRSQSVLSINSLSSPSVIKTTNIKENNYHNPDTLFKLERTSTLVVERAGAYQKAFEDEILGNGCRNLMCKPINQGGHYRTTYVSSPGPGHINNYNLSPHEQSWVSGSTTQTVNIVRSAPDRWVCENCNYEFHFGHEITAPSVKLTQDKDTTITVNSWLCTAPCPRGYYAYYGLRYNYQTNRTDRGPHKIFLDPKNHSWSSFIQSTWYTAMRTDAENSIFNNNSSNGTAGLEEVAGDTPIEPRSFIKVEDSCVIQ